MNFEQSRESLLSQSLDFLLENADLVVLSLHDFRELSIPRVIPHDLTRVGHDLAVLYIPLFGDGLKEISKF